MQSSPRRLPSRNADVTTRDAPLHGPPRCARDVISRRRKVSRERSCVGGQARCPVPLPPPRTSRALLTALAIKAGFDSRIEERRKRALRVRIGLAAAELVVCPRRVVDALQRREAS